MLQGARRLLQSPPRPAILAEVEDIRTRPWGYEACEIMRLLARRNYRWFALSEAGMLYPASPHEDCCDANYVALPDERSEEFQNLLTEASDSQFQPVHWQAGSQPELL